MKIKVEHNLNTQDVQVSMHDTETNETIFPLPLMSFEDENNLVFYVGFTRAITVVVDDGIRTHVECVNHPQEED